MVSRADNRNRKRKKWPFIVGGIVLFFILVIGGGAFYIWTQVGNVVESMHSPLDRDSDPERQDQINRLYSDADAVNMLLLGVDERDGDVGRSDTMILLSLNPKTDSMLMLSIPRDTYVNIPDRGMDKINHAYAFGEAAQTGGGTELSVETVEDAFDIPIHSYVRVNMEGFQQGIDALGGVDVQNSTAFSQDGHDFSEGNVNLNGEEALSYIRMRKEDSRGDMGRNERQRDVIVAAMDKAASFSSITKANNILDILGSNVQTDLDMKRLQNLFTDYSGTRNNVETMEIEGDGQTISGVWYYVVPDNEINRIHSTITEHMEQE
ncbi:LCP family glycopolymer transferase [Oceanobacillus locisalsi]|uniref:Polyisoprenyl-teichoic acid--peptidoglycan teichoic acid transferase TagU n=1 Tax=Oceanobacillus locisalsi TaxID=546107 RepID=A0ABW3NKS7_9BACI